MLSHLVAFSESFGLTDLMKEKYACILSMLHSSLSATSAATEQTKCKVHGNILHCSHLLL